MFRIGLGLLLALGGAVSGSAEEPQPLSAAELNAEIFGTHQWGHEANSGILVDECIEPSGLTVYRTRADERAAPYSEPGKLVITETAQACFTYPDSMTPGPHCFFVFRNGTGYIFQSVNSSARFIISEVQRGIQSCPPSGVFLS